MKQLWKLWLLLALGISGCTPVLGQHLTKMSGYGYEMQGLSVDSMFFVPVRDTGFTGSYKRAGALVFRTIGTDRTLYAYDGIKWINVTASLSKGLDSMVISGDSLIAYLTNGSQVVTKLPLYGVKSSNGTVSIIGNAKVWGDSLDLSASGGSSGGLTRDSAKYPVWADTGIVVTGGANTQFIDTVKIKARYYDALWNAASLLGVPIDTSALSDRDVLTYFGGVWTNMPVNNTVIDTTSLSNRINAKLNISDTTGHWQPLGDYAPPIVAGTGITYSSTTGMVSAKISAAGGNALTTDGGGGMYVPQPVAGTDTTVKGVIYNPTIDDTIRLTTNTLDTIKARMHLNTAIDSGVFISATNQMHLYRFNGDSIVMTILGGAVTSVNGHTGNVQLNLSILGRVVSLTDGSSVTIPHDSLSLSGNNLGIKGSNTVDISVPIKAIVGDTADAIRAGIHNLSDYNLVQDSIARIYSTNKGVLYLQDTTGTTPSTQLRIGPDSLVQTLMGDFKTTYTLKNSLINMDVYDRTGSELEARAQVNRSGLYLYTGVGGRDAGTPTLMLGNGGDITSSAYKNNEALDSIVRPDTSGVFKLTYMPHADSIMLRSDFTDSLANSFSAGESIPRRSIKGQGGVTILNGDSTTIGDTDVVVKVPKYVAGTNVTFGGTADSVVINASGGGSGTDSVHQASAPLTLTRSENVVTYGFDTTQFKTPTTDGKILLTGDAKMWHNAYLSLNPDSIWGAVPLGDSVSLPNTNLGNSDLSLSDAARWLNLNDGGLYVIDSINVTSPNSNYILGIDQNGLNVHWGKLKVAYTLPGTPGTDSIVVKHSGNEIRAISPKYYATPAQVVDSINAHAGTDANTNLANADLSLASAVARKFELNGGTVTFNDLNRTYGDPVAVIGKEAIHFTTEDDGGSYSANYDLDYGTSPSITESVLATGGSWTRSVDSDGFHWKQATDSIMDLADTYVWINVPLVANNITRMRAGTYLAVTNVTADYTVTAKDCIITANSSSGITITLPSAGYNGQMIVIKNIGSGTVTIVNLASVDSARNTVATGESAIIMAAGPWYRIDN